MTAQVEILVTELADVLSVPVQAVLEYQGKDHVAVKTDDGHDWRVVRLGISNDKLVEVREGLKTGEVVALNPIALMSEDEKRQAFGSGSSSGKDASRKDWGGLQKRHRQGGRRVRHARRRFPGRAGRQGRRRLWRQGRGEGQGQGEGGRRAG